MISKALTAILYTAYLFGVLYSHENIRLDRKGAIGTQASSFGILHGGQGNGVPSLDEISGGGISDFGILYLSKRWRAVEENISEDASNGSVGFSREGTLGFGVCTTSVRQESMHQSGSSVRRRSRSEYERSSGENLEAGRRNVINGEAYERRGYGNKNKQASNKRISSKIRSIRRNDNPHKGWSNLEDSWQQFTVTAYAFGCILPGNGKPEPNIKTKAANGKWPEANWTVAAPKELPFGTVLELSYQGIITTRIVGDRGRAIKGNRLDLFVSDCERAKVWGRRVVWVREIRRPLGVTRRTK